MREALFISHANPEDNSFARWLGAKLTAMGYEVWADVMRLHGGADWSRKLEDALRNLSIKQLVVCSPAAMEKQGVRNELEISVELQKELADAEFIVPLRYKPYRPHFRIAQLQYIDFSTSWASGLAELVELLATTYKVPRRASRSMDDWLASQSEGAARLLNQEERLTSNWLSFQSLPNNLHYCEPPSGFPIEKFQDRSLHRWPVVPHATGVLTFSEPDANGNLSPNMPAHKRASVPIETFLEQGWKPLEIGAYDAKRHFSDIVNQAFESYLNSRGLVAFEGTNAKRWWWGTIKNVPLKKIKFSWPDQHGLRQIIGQSKKRGVHWHLAISGQARSGPVLHMRVMWRLIFSNNGMDPISSAKRMHSLRRSFAKTWRNARWRDMLGAFLWWLSEGRDRIAVPVSLTRYAVLALPPMFFMSPVSALDTGDPLPDEDDPDIDEDESAGDEEEADDVSENEATNG